MTLSDFCGTDSIDDALAMWELERMEMIALREEAITARKNESRLRAALDVVEKMFKLLDGEMFLPKGVRDMMGKVRALKVFREE